MLPLKNTMTRVGANRVAAPAIDYPVEAPGDPDQQHRERKRLFFLRLGWSGRRTSGRLRSGPNQA